MATRGKRAPVCAGCGTVAIRYRITARDLWRTGQNCKATRHYCEPCWRIVLANLDQGAQLALLRESAGH